MCAGHVRGTQAGDNVAESDEKRDEKICSLSMILAFVEHTPRAKSSVDWIGAPAEANEKRVLVATLVDHPSTPVVRG